MGPEETVRRGEECWHPRLAAPALVGRVWCGRARYFAEVQNVLVVYENARGSLFRG
jgi:hypothetical protein